MEPENDESSKIRTHDFGSRKRQISPQLFAVVEIWFLIPLNVLRFSALLPYRQAPVQACDTCHQGMMLSNLSHC